MGRKVARGSRGKSGGMAAASGGGEERNRPSPNPSRKREGSKTDGGVRGRDANPFMPGLRVRADGWTAARTRVFLATLGQTGCITDAARIAGVSRTSVNRSRALFAPFDKACGAAIARALRGLEAVAYERAVEGREMVVIRGGKEVERRIVPSDSMLGLLIKRGDLKHGRDVQLTAEEAAAYELPAAVRHRFLSVDEFYSGITFDGREGGKAQRPTPEETDAEILRRIAIIEATRSREDLAGDRCRLCGQAIVGEARPRIEAKAAQRIPPRAAVWERPPIRLSHRPDDTFDDGDAVGKAAG